MKNTLYRDVAALIGRTAKSVEFKIQNVSACDPRPRREKPIAEAQNKQKLLREVFSWYWGDKERARAFYQKVIADLEFRLENESSLLNDPVAGSIFIEEGALETRNITHRTRSQRLVVEGRKHFRKLDPKGLLRCHACGFSTPDGIDSEIVHLHHTKQLADVDGEGRKVSLSAAISSLLPLCPTCHALAHTARPPLSAKQIAVLRGTPT